jgi:predicted DsbA family dithiol-disulfide isomerase
MIAAGGPVTLELMEIHVFSDVVCPWCFVGTERLERALTSLGMEARVKYHPFMLEPDAPPAGFNIAEDLRRKYQADPRQIQARAEAAARESGLDLDLSRQPMSYPTAPAHTLIRHAGPKKTQRGLVRALFQAYFQQALDISDLAVLQRVALPFGFADDEVAALVTDPDELAATRRAAEEAYTLGIEGAPFFIFNDAVAVSGAQPESVFREALEKAGPPKTAG